MGKIILKTDRLYLEELTDDHFPDLYLLLSNEKVHKYFPKTLDKKESEDFFQKVQRRYQEDGVSFWAVMRKEDNQFLGICGINKQLVDNNEEFEIGYRILDKFWGQGYGTEAARGCMEYGKNVLKKRSLVSFIRPINLQSIRVAEKNGLAYEKDIIFHDLPHRLYRITF